uniref:Uncharacterized protein n=1 Tax=Anguilla anguilla TaxID=7936 RepID=A0A0E9VSX6_ANGAN
MVAHAMGDLAEQMIK